MRYLGLVFTLGLFAIATAYGQNKKTITLFAEGAVPFGEMRQDDYTSAYGGGIRYEWEESKHINLSLSIHMLGWSQKEKIIQTDTSYEFGHFGGSPMEVSIPLEFSLNLKFVQNPLVPKLLLALGIYFGDGSTGDVVVPGIGGFISSGIGMQIPLTVAHAIDVRAKVVMGASSAIDVSYVGIDLGVAFAL